MTSPTSIDAELDALVEEFELLGDWEQRYRYLIELGRGLPAMSADEHSDANKVRGCASQVWLVAEPRQEQGEREKRRTQETNAKHGHSWRAISSNSTSASCRSMATDYSAWRA